MKKCSICGSQAAYRIKSNPDFYCKDCGIEHFGDISYLHKIEEEAIKRHVNAQ